MTNLSSERVAEIAGKLTADQRKAMLGHFFSDAVGEALLARGLFAAREGWPMTELGGKVSNFLRKQTLKSGGSNA